MGDLVHLLPVSEGAAELGGGHGPHEVHTPLTVFREKRVISRDLYGETLGVKDELTDRGGPVLLAALDSRGVLVREPGTEMLISA